MTCIFFLTSTILLITSFSKIALYYVIVFT